MQNTLIIKKLKNKAAKTILILFFIQVLITLLTFVFYKNRYIYLPPYIDLTSAYPSGAKELITAREDLFWKDILRLGANHPLFYILGKIVFGVIPTKFEMQRPKPKKIYIEIHLLYCRSFWQYIGFVIFSLLAINICEKIAFGSGLLGKNYVSIWGHYVNIVPTIVSLIMGYIIHRKMWINEFNSLSPTEED